MAVGERASGDGHDGDPDAAARRAPGDSVGLGAGMDDAAAAATPVDEPNGRSGAGVVRVGDGGAGARRVSPLRRRGGRLRAIANGVGEIGRHTPEIGTIRGVL